MSSYFEQELEARGVAQVIVVMRGAPASSATMTKAADTSRVGMIAALSSCFVRSPLSHASQIRRELGSAAATQGSPAARQGPLPPARYYPRLGVLLGAVDRAGLARLRRDARVRQVLSAPPLRLIHPRAARPVAAPARVPWGIAALGVPALHRQGLSGRGVLVGHLDTGVDGRHPALRGAVRHFAEFDALGRLVNPAKRPWDSDGHGTHTAGTIAGRRSGRASIGMAPSAELASAMVIEGGEAVARVLGGMDWAIEVGVRILSMSLGFSGWWSDFMPLTRVLRRRGILPVIAAGNEGAGQTRSPGNYPNVLSVGATTRDGRVAEFSSSQRFRRRQDALVPDLVAPGQGIISARSGGGYLSLDGTSMATAHIAGLAALLMEARPERSTADIERAILRSCRRGARMHAERAHRGLPDAVAALRLLG